MSLGTTLCEKWKASRLSRVVFARYIVIGMGFLVMIFNYALRVNINMTLVAMVKNRPPKNDTTYSGECGHHEIDDWGGIEPEPSYKGGDFDWDETRQTLIISAFFWGYIWTQIPGGKLGQRFGGKRVVALSILSTAICNLFVPIAARASYIYVILLRVGMGLSEGVIYPASICLITNYALPEERSRFNAIFTAGAEIGSVFAMPIAGILIANHGWEAVFYVFGGAGIGFVFFWMLLVYDSPTKHPYITDEEKALLESSLENEMAQNRKKLPVPWRALLTSVPVWTATYVMAASGWSYSVMLSLTPTYLKNMMNYDITKTGIMSGLPYLLMYGFSVVFSYFIDSLRRREFCTVSTLRKIGNLVSQMGQGVCLIILSFSGCSEVTALILINTSGLVYGATYSGHLAVPLDLSPNFSGIIYAFNNLGFTFLAMLGPLISGIIITGHQTLAKWALVFRIAAAINISNVVLFTIFGSAEVQPWNDSPGADGRNAQEDGGENTNDSDAITSAPSADSADAGDDNARQQQLQQRDEHVALSDIVAMSTLASVQQHRNYQTSAGDELLAAASPTTRCQSRNGYVVVDGGDGERHLVVGTESPRYQNAAATPENAARRRARRGDHSDNDDDDDDDAGGGGGRNGDDDAAVDPASLSTAECHVNRGFCGSSEGIEGDDEPNLRHATEQQRHRHQQRKISNIDESDETYH